MILEELEEYESGAAKENERCYSEQAFIIMIYIVLTLLIASNYF
jgi:hypothetical protein